MFITTSKCTVGSLLIAGRFNCGTGLVLTIIAEFYFLKPKFAFRSIIIAGYDRKDATWSRILGVFGDRPAIKPWSQLYENKHKSASQHRNHQYRNHGDRLRTVPRYGSLSQDKRSQGNLLSRKIYDLKEKEVIVATLVISSIRPHWEVSHESRINPPNANFDPFKCGLMITFVSRPIIVFV